MPRSRRGPRETRRVRGLTSRARGNDRRCEVSFNRRGLVALALVGLLLGLEASPATARQRKPKRTVRQSSNCLNVGVVAVATPAVSTFVLRPEDFPFFTLTVPLTVTVPGPLPPSGTAFVTVPIGAFGERFGAPFPPVPVQGVVEFTRNDGTVSGTLRVTGAFGNITFDILLVFPGSSEDIRFTFTPGSPGTLTCGNAT
jgi:hypothetical protein